MSDDHDRLDRSSEVGAGADATLKDDRSKPPWSRSIRVKVLRESVYQTEISHVAEPQPPARTTIDTIESLFPATELRPVLYRPKSAHRLHSSHGKVRSSVRGHAVSYSTV